VKFGRQPRTFDPRIPHSSAIRGARKKVVLLPETLGRRQSLPADLGMMKNDVLGCCTVAGMYHAIQTWTALANPPIETESDDNVVVTYAQACGYLPGDPSTDRGGNEQDVLAYWMGQGIPVYPSSGSFGTTVNRLVAYYEDDPRNVQDIRETILDCGVCYIGFQVPASLMANGIPADVWDVADDPGPIDGGHCVILVDYDKVGPWLVSWGRLYQMTWKFFGAYVDEAYGLINPDWIRAQGTTPLDMTVDQLKAQMAAVISD